MAMVIKEPHMMTLGWCKTGHHDKCRVQYGGGRIKCDCECKDHGINYQPINHVMSNAEAKHADAIINNEQFQLSQESAIENRALQPTSSIWGEQMSRLAEMDEEGTDLYRKRHNYRPDHLSDGYGGYKYLFTEVEDAANIEELEQRRLSAY